VGFPYPASGLRSRPPVMFLATHAPLHRRPGCCPPFCAPFRPRHQPIVQRHPTRVGNNSPACHPGPISHCTSPITFPLLPPDRFATFWARHCPLCRSIDGVPASTGNSVGASRRSHPPPSHPRPRSDSDHAGERYVHVPGRNREFRSDPVIATTTTQPHCSSTSSSLRITDHSFSGINCRLLSDKHILISSSDSASSLSDTPSISSVDSPLSSIIQQIITTAQIAGGIRQHRTTYCSLCCAGGISAAKLWLLARPRLLARDRAGCCVSRQLSEIVV